MQKETTTRRDFVSSSFAVALGALSPFTSGVAADNSNDWSTSSESADVDRDVVQQILKDAGSITALRSIVVVKNGILIGEQYFGSVTAADLQTLNSVTKSVTSMLIGIAIEQGKIKGLSETVGALLPAAAAKTSASAALSITLEQILTDTSGLVYDIRTDFRALSVAENPVAFVLGLPVDPQMVGKWIYNDAAISLLTPILQQAHGMSVDQLAQRDLFQPLGIEKVVADRDKAGNFMSYRGLRLRARDLAKIAWMMANDGQWRGKQIVPSQWVAESSRFHVPTTWNAAPMRQTGYGYLWFTGNLSGHPVFWAWGYGAQFALVVPSLRLAVTTTATDPDPRDLAAQNNAVMRVVAKIVAVAG